MGNIEDLPTVQFDNIHWSDKATETEEQQFKVYMRVLEFLKSIGVL